MYTGTLLDELIQLLLKLDCTVLVLSATLTKSRKNQLFKQPYKTYPIISQEKRTIKITYNNSHMPFDAIKHAKNGEVVLYISNTIKTAQGLYARIKNIKDSDGIEVGLLHSRYPLNVRKELEDYWLKKLGKNQTNRKPCILVATQVIEQSVDIDSDYIITEYAPSDNLIQRAGRLWRHNRPRPKSCQCIMNIIMPDLSNPSNLKNLYDKIGKSRFVYAPYILWRSYEVWKNINQITLPNDTKQILDCDTLYNELLSEFNNNIEEYHQKAKNICSFDRPAIQDDEFVAQTRYNNYPHTPVLAIQEVFENELQLLNGEKIVLTDKRETNTAIKIHKNIIQVPEKWIEDEVKTIYHSKLDNYSHYDSIKLLKADGRKLYWFDGTDSMLRYSKELGLYHEPKLGL